MKKNRYFDEEEDSEDDTNIYSRQIRDLMLEDDELSSWEEGFMCGYGENKMSNICIYCRTFIAKQGKYNYLCIDCEKIVRKAQVEERQIYLDNFI